MVNLATSLKKKVTFFYPPGQDTFLKPLIRALRKYYRVEEFPLINLDDQSVHRTIEDSDVCWFEWGNQFLAQMSQSMKPKKVKYIARIHSYEVFDKAQFAVNWNKIDKLIVPNDSVKNLICNGIKHGDAALIPGVPHTEEIAKQIPDIPTFGDDYLWLDPNKVHPIYHGIDLKKYQYEPRKRGKKIAYVGFLNYKKAPELLLQTFAEIYKRDHEFELHIAGAHQDPRIFLYFENMTSHLDNIFMHGWQDDIPGFLKDKDYVISTSLFESFQLSIMEGMAMGCIPLVHNWYGANNIYPTEFIWNTISDCYACIEQFEGLNDEEKEAAVKEIVGFVKDKYSFERQVEDTKNAIDEVLYG